MGIDFKSDKKAPAYFLSTKLLRHIYGTALLKTFSTKKKLKTNLTNSFGTCRIHWFFGRVKLKLTKCWLSFNSETLSNC